jgi:hypothetical protein
MRSLLELLLGCDPRRLGQGAISMEVTGKDSGRRSRGSHETLVEIGKGGNDSATFG